MVDTVGRLLVDLDVDDLSEASSTHSTEHRDDLSLSILPGDLPCASLTSAASLAN